MFNEVLRANSITPSEEIEEWFRIEFPDEENYTDTSFMEKIFDNPIDNLSRIRLVSEVTEYKERDFQY